MYLKYFKRIFDFSIALLGFTIALPIFLLLIIAIKIDSKRPVLFKQKRAGIHKNCFNILKFRTINIDAPKDCPTHLLEDADKYITRAGSFLRKTSLDELPQIINILVGQIIYERVLRDGRR